MTGRPDSIGGYRPRAAVIRSFHGTLWTVHPGSEGVTDADNEGATARVIEPLGADDRALISKTARAIRTLDHRAFVAVRDVIDEAELFAIVSDAVDGVSMRDALRIIGIKRRMLSIGETLRIALDMLAALTALHEESAALAAAGATCHGGVSPDSFVIGYDGVTRMLEPGLGAALSRTSVWAEDAKRAGYDAPEVLEGKDASARADLFSVGVIVWELLMGRRLFPGAAFDQIKRRVSAPIPTAGKRPKAEDVPDALGSVLARALARDPGERYGDAAEMAAALEAAAPGVAAAADVSATLMELSPRRAAAAPAPAGPKSSAPPRASDRPPPLSTRTPAVGADKAEKEPAPPSVDEPDAEPKEQAQPEQAKEQVGESPSEDAIEVAALSEREPVSAQPEKGEEGEKGEEAEKGEEPVAKRAPPKAKPRSPQKSEKSEAAEEPEKPKKLQKPQKPQKQAAVAPQPSRDSASDSLAPASSERGNTGLIVGLAIAVAAAVILYFVISGSGTGDEGTSTASARARQPPAPLPTHSQVTAPAAAHEPPAKVEPKEEPKEEPSAVPSSEPAAEPPPPPATQPPAAQPAKPASPKPPWPRPKTPPQTKPQPKPGKKKDYVPNDI